MLACSDEHTQKKEKYANMLYSPVGPGRVVILTGGTSDSITCILNYAAALTSGPKLIGAKTELKVETIEKLQKT